MLLYRPLNLLESFSICTFFIIGGFFSTYFCLCSLHTMRALRALHAQRMMYDNPELSPLYRRYTIDI